MRGAGVLSGMHSPVALQGEEGVRRGDVGWYPRGCGAAGEGHSPVSPRGDGALVGLAAEPGTELQGRASAVPVAAVAAVAAGDLLHPFQLWHQLHRQVVVPPQPQEVCGGLPVPQLSHAVAVPLGLVLVAGGTTQTMAQSQGAQQCQATKPDLRDRQRSGEGHSCTSQGTQPLGS